MKEKLTCFIIICSMALLGGCAGTVNKQQTGTAAGALIGAALGYGLGKGHKDKDLAIILGAMAGAWAGSTIGAQMDERDRLLDYENRQKVLESNPDGMNSSWRNPNTGYSGTAVPTKTYVASNGQDCRQYDVTINVGTETDRKSGTACRGADGVWAVN